MGLFVVAQRPRDPASLQFHHLVVLVATVLAFTWGCFRMNPIPIGYALRALFPVSNAFIGSMIIHFSIVFPKSRPLPRVGALLLHTPSALVSVWGIVASYQATMPFDYASAPIYYAATSTAKVMLGIGAVVSVAIFAGKFMREKDSGHRRQIAWAMTGTLLSTLAYVIWHLNTSGYIQARLPDNMIEFFDVLRIDEIVLNAALLVTATFMAIGIV